MEVLKRFIICRTSKSRNDVLAHGHIINPPAGIKEHLIAISHTAFFKSNELYFAAYVPFAGDDFALNTNAPFKIQSHHLSLNNPVGLQITRGHVLYGQISSLEFTHCRAKTIWVLVCPMTNEFAALRGKCCRSLGLQINRCSFVRNNAGKNSRNLNSRRELNGSHFRGFDQLLKPRKTSCADRHFIGKLLQNKT